MFRHALTNAFQIYGLVVSVMISGNRKTSHPGFFARTLTSHPQLLQRCRSSRALFSLVLVFLLAFPVSVPVSLSGSSVTPVSGVLRNNQGSLSEWLVHLPRGGPAY